LPIGLFLELVELVESQSWGVKTAEEVVALLFFYAPCVEDVLQLQVPFLVII